MGDIPLHCHSFGLSLRGRKLLLPQEIDYLKCVEGVGAERTVLGLYDLSLNDDGVPCSLRSFGGMVILNALVCSILGRLGGDGYIWLRRWGIPALILVNHPNLTGVISALGLFGVTSLPITLKGDDVRDNFLWIFFLGLLFGATLFPLRLDLLSAVCVALLYFTLIFGTTKTLNKGYDSWWLFEILFYMAYGINL